MSSVRNKSSDLSFPILSIIVSIFSHLSFSFSPDQTALCSSSRLSVNETRRIVRVCSEKQQRKRQTQSNENRRRTTYTTRYHATSHASIYHSISHTNATSVSSPFLSSKYTQQVTTTSSSSLHALSPFSSFLLTFPFVYSVSLALSLSPSSITFWSIFFTISALTIISTTAISTIARAALKQETTRRREENGSASHSKRVLQARGLVPLEARTEIETRVSEQEEINT